MARRKAVRKVEPAEVVPHPITRPGEERGPIRFAYLRVSTDDQTCRLQRDAMDEAGVPVENCVEEHASGADRRRPGLLSLLAGLREGDSLYVWKVDRLGRDAAHACDTATMLTERGVRIVITTLGIDLKTPAGRLVYGIMAQLAQFEREQTLERVRAGIAAAKRAGVHCGRRRALAAEAEDGALADYEAGETILALTRRLRVGEATLWRAIARARARRTAT